MRFSVVSIVAFLASTTISGVVVVAFAPSAQTCTTSTGHHGVIPSSSSSSSLSKKKNSIALYSAVEEELLIDAPQQQQQQQIEIVTSVEDKEEEEEEELLEITSEAVQSRVEKQLEKMRLKDQKSRQLTKEVCLIIPFCNLLQVIFSSSFFKTLICDCSFPLNGFVIVDAPAFISRI
jgi:Fe2+ transport system protein B